jgi:hypothetical protein
MRKRSSTVSGGASDIGPAYDRSVLDAADRVQIEELYARHAWALDTADVDGLAALYTDDAIIDDVLAGRFEGPDAARRYAAAARDDPDFAGRQHWTGHSRLEPAEQGWRIMSFGLATQLHPSGATFLPWLGYTDDVVVAQAGAWLFARRAFRRWEGDVLAAFPGR